MAFCDCVSTVPVDWLAASLVVGVAVAGMTVAGVTVEGVTSEGMVVEAVVETVCFSASRALPAATTATALTPPIKRRNSRRPIPVVAGVGCGGCGKM